MATALSYQTRAGVTLAYVLEIEGTQRVYTNVADAAGILTAWAGTGYTTSPGTTLEVPGAITRRIDLLGFRVEVVGLTLRILDADRGLASRFADADTSADLTYLTASVDRDDTTINVADTSAFSASGTIHVGHERITYSGGGGGGTTFTGCTRGVAGFGSLSHTHTVGTGSTGTAPEVSNKQRIWKGRGVTVYISVKQDDGTWTTRDNSIVYFAGYLKGGWKYDSRTGEWTLDCVSVENRMEHQILRDQYRSRAEGVVLSSSETFNVNEESNGVALGSGTQATITVPAGGYTIDELIASVNSLLAAERVAGRLTWYWSFGIAASNRAQVTIHDTVNNTQYREGLIAPTAPLTMTDSVVMKMLGATSPGDFPATGTGIYVAGLGNNVAAGNTLITVDMPLTAIKTLWHPTAHTSVTVQDEIGTWVAQQSDDLPGVGTAHGFVMIDGEEMLWLVTKSSTTFTRVSTWTLDGKPSGGGASSGRVVYVGEDRTIEVKQVWIAEGRMSKILLRMLHSTGTASYNGTDDVWPLQMGIGIPATFVDRNAILALDTGLGAAAKVRLIVTEPTPAVEEIESLMRARGFALVWKMGTGKITPVVSTNPTGLAADWTLDTDNTDIGGEGIDAEDGSELVRNKLTLLYNRDPASGEYMARETFTDVTSASDHEQPDPIEMEARSLYDVPGSVGGPLETWRKNVAGPFAAYFRKPIRRYIVTGAPSLMGISPGNIVEFTHPDAPNQETGLYGVTDLKCWVESVSFDPRESTFTLSLLVPRGKAYTMAPSAMLDYSRGDVGYDNTTQPGSPYLYCRAHEFSLSTEAVDVAAFDAAGLADPVAVDMRISVIEADPADPAAPLRWDNLLVLDSSTSSNYIQADQALAGFDTDRRYYVEYDDFSTIGTGAGSTSARDEQWLHAFIANDADNIIATLSGVSYYANLWSMFLAGSTSDVATGQDLFRRRADVADDTGEPLSVYKLRDSILNANALYRYICNPQPIDENFTAAHTVTATSYQWLAGPYPVNVPPGVVQMDVTLWCQMGSGGGGSPKAWYRVTASPAPPTGTVTAMTFPATKNQSETSSTNTAGYEEKTVTINLIPAADGRCWIAIEGKGAETNDVSRLGGVQGAFVAPTVS